MKNWLKVSWNAVRDYFDDQNASAIVRPVIRSVRPAIVDSDNGSILVLQRDVKDKQGVITSAQMPVVEIDLASIPEADHKAFMHGVIFGATETLHRLGSARYAELKQIHKIKVVTQRVKVKAPEKLMTENEIMGGDTRLVLAPAHGAT